MVWIGAQLVRGPRRRGVAEKKVTILGEKIDKTKYLGGAEAVEQWHDRQERSQKIAGLMAWVANLCPQLSPFTRML